MTDKEQMPLAASPFRDEPMVYISDALAAIEAATLKANQRQWVGLTEWEREAIAVECGAMSADWLVFMEAVERALKEKNS